MLQYDNPDQPGQQYVIKKKNDGGVWRLAYREIDSEALRIIYVGTTEADCKQYAQTFRDGLTQ